MRNASNLIRVFIVPLVFGIYANVLSAADAPAPALEAHTKILTKAVPRASFLTVTDLAADVPENAQITKVVWS